MLSILIPVYNCDLRQLISDLYIQSVSANIQFEIIVIDDASPDKSAELNREIEKNENCRFIRLTENIGRSKIRNKLAAMAQFDYLLFMDADAKVVDNYYIDRYLQCCFGQIVVCGGTTYGSKPDSVDLFLRWHYGIEREKKTANERNKCPNRSFTTFNFLISHQLFNKIKFNDTIVGYGHEDTLFGYSLKKNGYQIKHIDNPLIHTGIDNNEIFIQKTRQSVKNVLHISEKYKNDQELIYDIKLLTIFIKVKKYRIIWLVSIFYYLSEKFILKNLKSKNPKLKLFDFCKLAWMCSKR